MPRKPAQRAKRRLKAAPPAELPSPVAMPVAMAASKKPTATAEPSMRRMVLERLAILVGAVVVCGSIALLSSLHWQTTHHSETSAQTTAKTEAKTIALLSNGLRTAKLQPPQVPPAPQPTPKPSEPKAEPSIEPPSALRAMSASPMPNVPFVRDYNVPATKFPIPQPGQLAPVIWRIETTEPVVFLTMDDGAVKDPRAVAFLREHHIVTSVFLANSFLEGNYNYFREITVNGSLIENHTLTHPLDLHKRPYEQQRAEICGAADLYAGIYGRRPILYRPPGGSYNETTQRAAADCGMRAVVIWHAKVDGGAMQWQSENNHLLPGDIVLMHFRPMVMEDLIAFMNAVNEAHLKVALLEDWFE